MDNPIISQLRQVATLTQWDKGQQAFFDQQLADAKEIKMSKLSDVFTPREINLIKNIVRPQKNQCYRNSALMAELFPDRCKYVEGFGYSLFNIDHAWNKVGDKYVDVTWELVLKEDTTKRVYVALIEASAEEIVKDISEHDNIVGDYYRRYYIKTHFNK